MARELSLAVLDGQAYCDGIRRHQDDCAARAREFLEKNSDAATCLRLGNAIVAVLDKIASCKFGCAGGDHIVEQLITKYCNSANAATLLFHNGLYDQAISNVRSMAEISNLLSLFWFQPSSQAEFSSSGADQRRRNFAPAAVRKKLEAVGCPPAFSRDIYGLYSGMAVHPDPDVSANAHNAAKISFGRPEFQVRGFVLSLYETCYLHQLEATRASDLHRLPDAARTSLVVLAEALDSSLPGLQLQFRS